MQATIRQSAAVIRVLECRSDLFGRADGLAHFSRTSLVVESAVCVAAGSHCRSVGGFRQEVQSGIIVEAETHVACSAHTHAQPQHPLSIVPNTELHRQIAISEESSVWVTA